MKKLLLCVLSIFILFSTTTLCYAGDIPESLLSNDSAQVFFGEIKSVSGDSITVFQRQNIKGEFLEGRQQTYAAFSFAGSPIIGKTYLCGFYDEINPLHLWEVDSLETKDLKIKSKDDMSKRMQKYLNDGKFEEKEKERLSEIAANQDHSSVTQEALSTDATDSSNRTDKETPMRNSFSVILIFFVIFIIGIVSILLYKRKG